MARPKSPEKKEQIRKAAIRVISEEGFYNCTTDKIAEEAGVSVGTIYNYFNDKKDILSYIFKIEHKKLDIYFKRISKELSVPEKITVLIERYYKYIFNNIKLAKLIYDESNRISDVITQEIFNYLLAIREHVKKLLQEGIEEGTVSSEPDLDMMVNMIIGSTNAVGFMGMIQPDKIDYICEKAPENLYKMLSEGIFV